MKSKLLKKMAAIKVASISSVTMFTIIGFQNCSPNSFKATQESQLSSLSLAKGQCQNDKGEIFEDGSSFQESIVCSNKSTIVHNYKCSAGSIVNIGSKDVCPGDINTCSKNGLFYNDQALLEEILKCDDGTEKLNKFKCVSGNFVIIEQASCTQNTASSACSFQGVQYPQGPVSINRPCSNGIIVIDKYKCSSGILALTEQGSCQINFSANTQIPSCSAGQVLNTSTNQCVAISQTCSVSNGTGVQNFDQSTNRYGTCSIVSCNANFQLDSNHSSCIPSQCPGGETNYPTCSLCPNGLVKVNGTCGSCPAGQIYDLQTLTCKSTELICSNGAVKSADGKSCVTPVYSFTINNLNFDSSFNAYTVTNTFDADISPGKVNSVSLAITNTGNTACTLKADQINNLLSGLENYSSNLSIIPGTFFSNVPVGGQTSVNFNDTMINLKPDLGAYLVNSNQALHNIRFKCAEDTSGSSFKSVFIFPKMNVLSNVLTCGLNTCGNLNSTASNYFFPQTATGKRVLPGENLTLYPTANDQKILISKGAQVAVLTSWPGLTYYFERPIAEYSFSSSGNQFKVTDSCGRISMFGASNTATLVFPEGYMKVLLVDGTPPIWKITEKGASANVNAITENVSQVESSLKLNLSVGISSQPYFTCPLVNP